MARAQGRLVARRFYAGVGSRWQLAGATYRQGQTVRLITDMTSIDGGIGLPVKYGPGGGSCRFAACWGLVVLVSISVLGGGSCTKTGVIDVLSWQDATDSAGLAAATSTFDLATSDYDGDGLVDLLVVNHRTSPRLFRNLGNGQFEDAAAASGLVTLPADLDLIAGRPPWQEAGEEGFSLWHSPDPYGGWFLGWHGKPGFSGALRTQMRFYDVHYEGPGVAVEYGAKEVRFTVPPGNGDGWLSFKMTAVGGLFEHDVAIANLQGEPSVHMGRDGTAVDIRGVVLGNPDNHRACWLDFDRDGDLDLYLSRGANRRKALGWKHDAFFVQERGHFIERGQRLGLGNPDGSGRGVTSLDVNQDGWPDLVVVNYLTPTLLYLNQAGKGFVEVGETYGIRNLPDARVLEVASVDYDRDGFPDLVIGGEGAFLFHNDAGQRFVEVKEFTAAAREARVSAIRWADWDGDGDEDLYLACQGGLPGFVWNNDTSIRYAQTLEKGSVATIDLRPTGPLSRLDLYLGGQRFADAIDDPQQTSPGRRAAGSPVDYEGARYTVERGGGRLVVHLDNSKGTRAVRFSGIITSDSSLSPVEAKGFSSSSSSMSMRQVLHDVAAYWPARGDLMFENLGNGGFRKWSLWKHGLTGASRDVAFADFDGDGDLDLFRLRNSEPDGLGLSQLLLNDGRGKFDVVMERAMSPYPAIGDRVVTFDADGDGAPDLFATNGAALEPGLSQGPYVLLLNRMSGDHPRDSPTAENGG